MSLLAIVAAVMLVLTNGVFVAVEFAMVASQRAKLELLAGTGSKRADIALATIRDLPRQLAGSQLGITVCSLGLGVLGEPAVADVIGPILDKIGLLSHNVSHGIAFALSLALVVTAHMVLGEMVPKGVALAGREAAEGRFGEEGDGTFPAQRRESGVALGPGPGPELDVGDVDVFEVHVVVSSVGAGR